MRTIRKKVNLDELPADQASIIALALHTVPDTYMIAEDVTRSSREEVNCGCLYYINSVTSNCLFHFPIFVHAAIIIIIIIRHRHHAIITTSLEEAIYTKHLLEEAFLIFPYILKDEELTGKGKAAVSESMDFSLFVFEHF
uniref:Uncharacterized protein n=1 Tax=Elaeophora elaphi TaxID=1147741 RepID=A0A0R3RL59_9BILA